MEGDQNSGEAARARKDEMSRLSKRSPQRRVTKSMDDGGGAEGGGRG